MTTLGDFVTTTLSWASDGRDDRRAPLLCHPFNVIAAAVFVDGIVRLPPFLRSLHLPLGLGAITP